MPTRLSSGRGGWHRLVCSGESLAAASSAASKLLTRCGWRPPARDINNRVEVLGQQAGAADQHAIDVWRVQDRARCGALPNRHRGSRSAAQQSRTAFPAPRANVRAPRRSGLASASCPIRLPTGVKAIEARAPAGMSGKLAASWSPKTFSTSPSRRCACVSPMQTIVVRPWCHGRFDLRPHDCVGLVTHLAALGMAEDHADRACVAQHLGVDVASERSCLLGAAILAADMDHAVRHLHRARDQRCRNADEHVELAGCLADQRPTGSRSYPRADRPLRRPWRDNRSRRRRGFRRAATHRRHMVAQGSADRLVRSALMSGHRLSKENCAGGSSNHTRLPFRNNASLAVTISKRSAQSPACELAISCRH
jgi:hypothetical protein